MFIKEVSGWKFNVEKVGEIIFEVTGNEQVIAYVNSLQEGKDVIEEYIISDYFKKNIK